MFYVTCLKLGLALLTDSFMNRRNLPNSHEVDLNTRGRDRYGQKRTNSMTLNVLEIPCRMSGRQP